MNILGLNAFHGDASAALFSDGLLVAAAEEERFNRLKHWAGFPAAAARYCLAGIDPASLAHVAISRDPRAHLWRKLAHATVRPGDWRRLASRARNAAKVAGLAARLNSSGIAHADQVRIHHVEHHRAHMASAFFASPFETAAIVSIDGFGDYSSLMWGVGRGNRFDVCGGVRFPHSLGLFYTAFTQFLGFPKFGDEYKMMGLAAYGEPRFVRAVRDVLGISGGQVRLNLDYFVHHTRGVKMSWDDCEPSIGTVYSPRMAAAFGPPRVPGSEILPRHRDLAASVQAVLEEDYFAILNFVQHRTGLKKVCLAGGVALNCVANGMIFEKTDFHDVYVQPAAHDAGTAIGAALYVRHQVLNEPRWFEMKHVYFGAQYSEAVIRRDLESVSATFHQLSEDQLVARTAAQIAEGKIVGWFQGRMEFGPRALGNRSILADPRRRCMLDILNSRIKYREPFRPFCPSVLAECAGQYFENDYPSPFMVMAYKIKPCMRASIPAVVHNDGTGRLQTVQRDVNPLYWKLIRAFGDRTGVPVLLNTSFNENEPIVNTPAQAIDCFLRTRMDVLVIGSYFLLKTENAGITLRRAIAAAA
jgi:carbamoyltransferase